ncbi:MAG TPA: hypothetical protein VKA77_08630, partial [Mycobacterium sp.]|nr:hypothetical protein [Mycobacterium sp.]
MKADDQPGFKGRLADGTPVFTYSPPEDLSQFAREQRSSRNGDHPGPPPDEPPPDADGYVGEWNG